MFLSGIVLILFLVEVKTYRVSGKSMQPTLQDKDRLFVKKNVVPTRYSLITFQPKRAPHDSYIKRVIGLPGDRILVDQNTVYLNTEETSSNQKKRNKTNLSAAELQDGTLKIQVTWEVAAQLERFSEIPKDRFFVLGDNRQHSTDSRALGLVDKKAIQGKVIFRYYPFTHLGPVD